MKPKPSRRSEALALLQASGNDLNLAIETLRSLDNDQKTKQQTKPTSSNEILVTVQDVSKRYKIGKNYVDALKNVSVDIYKGEFVAITGTSGSGKSTLLHQIGGLDKPTTGTVEVAGKNIAKLRDSKLSRFRNQTIGFVFQFFYLQPFINLQTNIEIPGMFARIKPLDRRDQSAALANIVGLGERLNHLPRELSGGQMQRAAIARALQNNPLLLLADEPTGNLDRSNALAIFDLFQKIRNEQGTTVVVVTHDTELASMADRIIRMSDGEISK